jgi:hypothetical protein
MTCRHYSNGCTLGLYGGRPSSGVCRVCPSYRGRWRGMGDVVRTLARILFLGRLDIAERLAGRVEALWSRRREKVSVRLPTTPRRPCGCKGRQQRLNALLPFGK